MLTTAKIEFRRGLYLMTRHYQHGATKEMLQRHQLSDSVWQTLLDRDLMILRGGRYFLTPRGLSQARTVFGSLAAQLTTLEQAPIEHVDGYIFIADLVAVGNQVTVKYLADEQGNQTTDVEAALVCETTNWRLKKKLVRELNVQPLFRTFKVTPSTDDDTLVSASKKTDYSDWLK